MMRRDGGIVPYQLPRSSYQALSDALTGAQRAEIKRPFPRPRAAPSLGIPPKSPQVVCVEDASKNFATFATFTAKPVASA